MTSIEHLNLLNFLERIILCICISNTLWHIRLREILHHLIALELEHLRLFTCHANLAWLKHKVPRVFPQIIASL
jgi:hypothetical protein